MFSPRQPSPSATTQLTAPSRAAKGDRRATRRAASSLWGMVTESPRRPSVLAPARAAAVWPAGTRNPTETQSRPSSAKAVLCRSGESEWATGSPMTPTTVVAADSPAGTAADGVRGSGAAVHQPTPRCWASASLACCSAKVSAKASVPSRWTTTKYSHVPLGGSRVARNAASDGKQMGVGVRPLLR